MYCLLPMASVMVPVLSHRFGCDPVWFWTATVSPIDSSGSDLVCSLYLSMSLRWRLASALSLSSASSCHSGLMRKASGIEGRWSRRTRPYKSCAGEVLRSASGVLWYCNRALAAWSVRMSPFGAVFSCRIRFVVFTANSALPLL